MTKDKMLIDGDFLKSYKTVLERGCIAQFSNIK